MSHRRYVSDYIKCVSKLIPRMFKIYSVPLHLLFIEYVTMYQNRIPSLDISISYYAFIVILLTYEFLLHGKDDDEEVEQSD